MRSLRPVASALRIQATPRSSRPVSQSPCLLCAHRTTPQTPSRRYQSTATSTDSNASAPPQSPPQTHFDFFPTTLPSGPPPAGHFTIDTTALKREFLQLQARAHPDLHPPENKTKAQALSARINEAYKTLQNPLLRAQYLLSLRGIEVAEDETAKVDDPELLMEVLDAREQIEEAESEEDLVEMKRENEARIASSVKVLEEAFARDDVQGAKSEAVKLRYWINIKESLDNWERGKPVVLEH
ncbi:molecular chaperone [Paraconiothyrium brasiliense]|uniref:Molecular chaperone n=1 Tax=Paraconiothyrium brasiliense TaxID=300254 RepID=A0ABR3RI48_9PLEO